MADTQTLCVSLGGEERELRLSVAVVRLAEQRHDVTFELQELMQDPVAVVPRLLHMCLLVDDEDVTESQALRWLAKKDAETQEKVEDFLLNQLERVVDIMGKSSAALRKAVPRLSDDERQIMTDAMQKEIRRIADQQGQNSSTGGT
jgi:hypothetical protein